MVAKYKSFEHVGGPQQPYEMQTQMELKQLRMRVGLESFVDWKKRRKSERNAQKRCCNFRNAESEALGRTQVNDGESIKPNEQRRPRNLSPLDLSIAPRTEGTLVQLCGDSNVAENGSMCIARWGRNIRKRLVRFRRRRIRVEEEKTLLCEDDRRLCEAHFQEAQPGG